MRNIKKNHSDKDIVVGNAIVQFCPKHKAWVMPFSEKDDEGHWCAVIEKSKVRAFEKAKQLNSIIRKNLERAAA